MSRDARLGVVIIPVMTHLCSPASERRQNLKHAAHLCPGIVVDRHTVEKGARHDEDVRQCGVIGLGSGQDVCDGPRWSTLLGDTCGGAGARPITDGHGGGEGGHGS